MKQKLTKSFVENLPLSVSGQDFYRDSEMKGFGLRVGLKTKVYIAESKVHGKTVRITIGRHDVFTGDEARHEAKALLGMLARGINPNDIEKERKAKSITLIQVAEDYLIARKNLRPTTIKDYRRVLNSYLFEWKNKPIIEITKDMVVKMHRKIGERSPAQANICFRYLRALMNFAIAQYEDSKGNPIIPFNPVIRLSQTRAWYPERRRQTVIKSHQLPAWYAAVMNLKNDTISPTREVTRDYLLLILFTGLRRSEAVHLTWDRVDFKARTLTITDTKNHQDHVLPLTDYLMDLLQRRREQSLGYYVFPGDGQFGYLIEPNKQMKNVIRESGVPFALHDLRRTFITIAESLDIPAYALKRLLNHKMANDVTAGYIIIDVERLRQPMQRITDYILRCVGEKESATVVPMTFGQIP